jgi:hypothetical protein
MASDKTPLRYPGGKQRLWPFIDELLSATACSAGIMWNRTLAERASLSNFCFAAESREFT